MCDMDAGRLYKNDNAPARKYSSQTAIFSFILGREKIGSGTPPIEKAVLASTEAITNNHPPLLVSSPRLFGRGALID